MATPLAKAEYSSVPEDEEGVQSTAAVAVALDANNKSDDRNVKHDSARSKQDHDSAQQLEVDGQPWTRGERQEDAFRDKWFAVAFLLHLVAVIGTAILLFGNWSNLANNDGGSDRRLYEDSSYGDSYGNNSNFPGSGGYQTSTSQESTQDDAPAGMIGAIVAASALLAPILSIVGLGVMSKNAVRLLEFSLIFSVALNVLLMVVALVYRVIFSVVVHAVFAMLLAFYAKSVWHRIPYAAANLKTAVKAVQLNLGLMLVALSSMLVFCLWIVTWTAAFGGAIMQPDLMTTTATEEHCFSDGTCTEPGDTVVSAVGFVLYVFFILSFYWTHQVIQNVLRATVAGTVGTFWFSPLEAASFCSRGVSDSLVRSTTYSLGSICFGSLIVAIIQVMRSLLRSTANNRRSGILRCIAECILLYIERIAEYFNKWAFIYVGLYGYGYIEAGKAVMDLFKARCWSTIISDNLVNRLLGIVILLIGLLIGVASVLISLAFEVAGKASGWLVPGFL